MHRQYLNKWNKPVDELARALLFFKRPTELSEAAEIFRQMLSGSHVGYNDSVEQYPV